MSADNVNVCFTIWDEQIQRVIKTPEHCRKCYECWVYWKYMFAIINFIAKQLVNVAICCWDN